MNMEQILKLAGDTITLSQFNAIEESECVKGFQCNGLKNDLYWYYVVFNKEFVDEYSVKHIDIYLNRQNRVFLKMKEILLEK